METITIEFESSIKTKILELLNSFPSNELKIVNDDPNFSANKKMLDAALEEVNNGTAECCSVEELEDFLEKSLSEYEN